MNIKKKLIIYKKLIYILKLIIDYNNFKANFIIHKY